MGQRSGGDAPRPGLLDLRHHQHQPHLQRTPGPDISLPRVTVIAQPEIVDPGQTVYLAVAALDDTTILSRTLTVNGVPQPLDPYGQASYVPVVAGIYTATGTATDLDGNTGHDTAYFRARAAVDNGPPQVALLAPAGDSIISATTNLTGTATDSDLAYYELQARPGDTGDYSTFLRRFSPVLTGTLGALNPRPSRPASTTCASAPKTPGATRAAAPPAL